MSSLAKSYISEAEYLELERNSEEKHEYYDGELILMTGASRRHNLIVANIIGEIRQLLKGRDCEVYPSDMKVKVPKVKTYCYPDISVACDEPKFDDQAADVLINPIIIIEVLSDSTESKDRGKKFLRYQRIESLKEYILVAQDECRVERFSKKNKNEWIYSEFEDLADNLILQSLNCQVSLKEIYHKVKLT